MYKGVFPYQIILASNSPRRRELLAGLDLNFEVKVVSGIEEAYPEELPVEKIAQYLSVQKAEAYKSLLDESKLVLTADTIVVVDGQVLGKPADKNDAIRMLRLLSGREHSVITGVCFTTLNRQHSFSVSTKVTFTSLSDSDIFYYVDTYKPYDKAGAYGIQEWIGYVGVKRLEGSYFNVMGLPVQRIWDELKSFSGL